MSGLTAKNFGLANRGTIAAGHHADIVIFDATTVIDKATYDTPTEPAEGIEAVIVNGALTWHQGAIAARAMAKSSHEVITRAQVVLIFFAARRRRKLPDRLSTRHGIGPDFRCLQAERAARLRQLDRAGDAVDDRQAVLFGQTRGEFGHAGATEHDGLGAVFLLGAFDFRAICAEALEAGSSSASTGTSQARTLAQRLARPYFIRLVSIAGIERDERRDDRETMCHH